MLLATFVLGSHVVRAADIPVTGPGKKLQAIDDALLGHLNRSRCTAATFALQINGRLEYSRGYGWLDLKKTRVTPADTPMRVASVSKPITAAAIHKLISAGKLSEATEILPLIKIDPPPEMDPRWREITVGDLLAHKGGWDIKQLGFDPMFNGPRAAKELNLDRAAKPVDMIRWMLTKPLQFNHGERSAYSNFGYCVLGRVIEQTARRPYIVYIQQEICRPAGIGPKGMWLGQSDPVKRNPREPEYNAECNVDIMDAHGGIVVSSPTLCQYLAHYWISGKPRKAGQRGYVYTFFGSMPGTSAIAH